MLDLRRLDGVCDALKAMAAKARSEREQAERRRILPMLHKGQWTHALITIDCSETEAQLVKGFRSFLRENTERLKEYRDTPMGKTGTAKDALKALASWRLLAHFKGNWVKADLFAEKHRKKTPAGEARAFHDHRKGKDGLKPNEAPLYGRKSGFQSATEMAQTHLGQMPAAFFKSADDAEVLKDRLKEASKQLPGDYGVKEIFDVLEHSMPDADTPQDSESKPPVSEPDSDRTETLRQGEPERPERE